MPLAVSVLYLGANRHLQAYDDIRVGGTGTAQVSLNRKLCVAQHRRLATGGLVAQALANGG